MPLDTLSIGKRIKYYRTEKDLSQDELASIVSTTHKHISNIETGVKAPSIDMLVLIANALNVSSDDLLVDNLLHSSSPVKTEIHDLLMDCNHDEKAILIRTIKFLKELLSEFGI